MPEDALLLTSHAVIMAFSENNKKESAAKKRKLIDYEDDDNESDAKREDVRSRSCPYLDTINRGLLDFDFEKLCSISLSKINCYACLVCGKYFQGWFIFSCIHCNEPQK